MVAGGLGVFVTQVSCEADAICITVSISRPREETLELANDGVVVEIQNKSQFLLVRL